MNREPLIMACYSDISGQVRGKGFPARDLEAHLVSGIGWTPTNIMIMAFGPIANTPFGALDDLILLPDPATETRVDFGDGSPPEHFFLSDALELDGRPWDCCPRSFLKAGLAELEGLGFRLNAAFEHEFYYEGAAERIGTGYNLDAIRRQGEFGEAFLYALTAAGLEPDSFLPEYGPRQYEVTCRPAIGVAAADRAAILRELARATAIRLGHRVSFAPMVRPDGGVGNGLHIHMSLQDLDGRPVTYDAESPMGLSQAAGRFVAGLLKHLPALCAYTVPAVVSYQRLVPHKWSASYNNMARQDREAAVRLCPINRIGGGEVAEQFNFEYRAADSAASPYITLGVLVRAGVAGLKAGLPAPEEQRDVPGEEDDETWAKRGIMRLPQSLTEALDTLEADPVASSWMPPTFHDAYLRYKRYEVDMMQDLSPEELCAKYAEAY